MTFWLSETEEQTVLRLANGELWSLTPEEKLALDTAWKAESQWHRKQATIHKHETAKRIPRHKGSAKVYGRTAAYYAHTAAIFNARWDIWKLALDIAHNPPAEYTTAQAQHHAQIYRTAAIAARMNVPLQQAISRIAQEHKQSNTTYVRSDYEVIDHTTPARMDAAAQHVTEPHTQAMAQTLAGWAGGEEWMDVVAKCKARLRLELQRGEWVRDGVYWLPISHADIRVHAKRCRYPDYGGSPPQNGGYPPFQTPAVTDSADRDGRSATNDEESSLTAKEE